MKTQVILTCFAGRQANMEIGLQYTDKLYAQGDIDEFHIWDFARDECDRIWLPSVAKNRPYIKFITSEKKLKWSDYYTYYTEGRFPNHVIVKIDDDIIFLDTKQFALYIQKTLQYQDECLMMFPSIVNNGVCAYYQQQHGYIPISVGEFPYDCFCGKLWDSGPLCQNLHSYFTNNWKDWIQKSRDSNRLIVHQIGNRISINFFAVTSKNLRIFELVQYREDEHVLSVEATARYRKPLFIDEGFTVAHLTFCRQRETGADEPKIRDMYRKVLEENI